MKTLLTLTIAVLLLDACESITGNRTDHEYKKESIRTIDLTDESKLVMDHTNGGITITGSETAQNIVVEMTKRVRSHSLEDAKEHIDDIIISEHTHINEVFVEVEHPGNTGREYQVDFVIVLPAQFEFDLALGNGGIAIESTEGNISVDLGNGGVAISAIKGNLAIDLGNGGVEADFIPADSCDIDINVGNGGI
ncbi:hypothetical protein ACFL5V_12225, partial [Fibrobacterota bacterium]